MSNLNLSGHLEDFLKNDVRFLHLVFQDQVLCHVDLQFLTLQHSTLIHCKFQGIYFDSVQFQNCVFQNCQFVDCSFYHSVFQNNRFEQCDFVNVKWTLQNFSNDFFEDSLLKYSEMQKTNFKGLQFFTCKFFDWHNSKGVYQDVHFQGCQFKNSSFRDQQLTNVDFSTSSLEETFLDILKLKNCVLTPSQGMDLLTYYGVLF